MSRNTADRAHGQTKTAETLLNTVIETTESDGLGITRILVAKRILPIAANSVNFYTRIVKKPSSHGQKQSVVIRNKFIADNTIPYLSLMSRKIDQLLPLVHCWCLPFLAPVHSGSIIFRLQSCQIVPKTIVAIVWNETILGQSRLIPYHFIAIFVCIPPIHGFRLCFAPSQIIAIIFGRNRANVARSPQGATRQVQIHIGMPIYFTWFILNVFIFVASCNRKQCDKQRYDKYLFHDRGCLLIHRSS